MPRKKLALAPPAEPQTLETQANEEPKPKKQPRTKKTAKSAIVEAIAVEARPSEALPVEVAEEVHAVVEAPPVLATDKKPKKSRKKVEQPTVEAEVQPDQESPVELQAESERTEVTFRPKQPRKTQKISIPVQTEDETTVVVSPVTIDVPAPKEKRQRKKPAGQLSEPAQVQTEIAVIVEQEPEPQIPVTVFTLEDESLLIGGEELPIPQWRPRQKAAARTLSPLKTENPTAAVTEGGGHAGEPRQHGGRRSRDKRRREAHTTVIATEPAPVPPIPAALPNQEPEPEILRPSFKRDRVAPAPPPKPVIQIPESAPQIVLRDGIPTLVRNHKVYPPIMYFGSPADERRSNTVLDELRMAADAGIHLHSFLIDFEVDSEQVDHAAAFAAYMLAKTVEIDPQAQIVFRLVFQAPRGWQDIYTNARFKHADGSLAEPSVCDDEFWSAAESCLERFVRLVRLLPQRDNIIGLHLERGEWFFPEGFGYDTSKAAQLKFRDWAKTRYNNDEVTLRASWFDGTVRFDNIVIPEDEPNSNSDEKFIRSSRKQRKFVDYHLFLSDATVHRIGDLAYAAKAASDGFFIIGVSYGYTFEWSHPSSGHLSLGKLLRTPEIDFIAGPPSYRTREPGGSAPFPSPIDSFALNGKLYISEEDFKTSLSIGHEPDDFNPTLKTPQALESAHWRGAGVALAHATGMAWMDLWGNGWLKTNSVWERASKVKGALIDRMQTEPGDPEVAIFIDERALAYLVDSHAFKLLVQNVRESVLRAGVSAAFYLLSDLAHREKFPESKLYLFLNAWDVRPELRAAIKSRLQRDNKVLFWLYTAGLFDAGRDSLERAREVTGIALKPQPFYSKSGTTILNRRHPLSEAFPDKSLIGSTKLEPSYFAIPEGATVLGEYTQTGLPSFVVRDFKEGPPDTHWTSIFLGEPIVNAALIRSLAQMAGAHVWNFHEDVVHVRAPFCTIHCSGAGPRAVTLPNKFSAFNLLTNEWAAVDSTNLRFTAIDGSTHVFLVGPKEDLEQLLDANPNSVLTIDKLPPRETNNRADISNFDVPIMKLDEWMEGGDSDEVADEWFLRPQQIVEEPETEDEGSEKIGRRRRKRRGRNDRGGSEETAGPRRELTGHAQDPILGDLGMNVMFRKRE